MIATAAIVVALAANARGSSGDVKATVARCYIDSAGGPQADLAVANSTAQLRVVHIDVAFYSAGQEVSEGGVSEYASPHATAIMTTLDRSAYPGAGQPACKVLNIVQAAAQ